MSYVDGFVAAVPKARIEDYRKLASEAGKVWMEHGALQFIEAVEDDVAIGELTSFPRAVQRKDDEVVVFAFITYRDRAHRDEVNARVMDDPRMVDDPTDRPFDGKRMIFGGFAAMVEY